ncbi:DUF2190 family protein [bacterium]|nr:DUF2190 family protein [bacterium]
MTQYNLGSKAFIAEEALEANRRVKLGTAANQVVYADQSDSDNYIGVTEAKAAINTYVSVALKQPGRTFKVVADGIQSAKCVLYAADDGKVSDTASGNPIGVALEAATADGEVIESILEDTASAEMDGASTAIEAENGNGSIPIIFSKAGITDAKGGDVVFLTSAPFDCRIIKWWLISRDTTAANITVKNGSANVVGTSTAKGTADDVVVDGAGIVAEYDEVAAGASLKVAASAVAAFDIFVMVIRI